jgi:cell division protein FtsB
MLKKIPTFIKNKFFITGLVFAVLITFFDRYDLISQYSLRKQLNKLKEEKQYYLDEIKKNNEELKALQNDHENLEKFAREKYLMKKDEEEIFVIVKDQEEESVTKQ